MKCKGRKNGEPCGSIVCRTDGEAVFIKLDSGRELTLRPRKALGIICENCEYENIWYKSGDNLLVK